MAYEMPSMEGEMKKMNKRETLLEEKTRVESRLKDIKAENEASRQKAGGKGNPNNKLNPDNFDDNIFERQRLEDRLREIEQEIAAL